MADIPSRFDSHLWSSAVAGQIDRLSAAAAAAIGKPQEVIVAETVIVEHLNPLAAIGPKQHAGIDTLTVGAVTVMRVDHEDGFFTLSAWPTAHTGVFNLVSGVPASSRRWDMVDRWINNAAPQVVRCFLDHTDFLDIGTALAEHADVEVQRLTGRMRQDWSGYSRSFPALSGNALRPDPREIVAEAEGHGAAVRSMHLHVGGVVDVAIRRQAGASFVHGDFDVFENRVLDRLALAAHRRRDLMANRQRVVHEAPKQPIEIRLTHERLNDADDTGEVLAELGAASHNLAFAVYHRNPYLHVAVMDERDGSDYDVFVTRPNAIEIHPGYRATLGSFTRLTQILSDRFEARAVVEEASEEPLSFYDFVDANADDHDTRA